MHARRGRDRACDRNRAPGEKRLLEGARRARGTRARMQAEAGETECWLCAFATDDVAQRVSALIVDNVHAMQIETIAAQAAQLIADEARARYGADVALAGHTAADVRRHIRSHMLHAPVALACALRDLRGLTAEVRQHVYAVDEETGLRALDAAQVRSYLALVGQTAAIYKMGDSGKLLFARRD